MNIVVPQNIIDDALNGLKTLEEIFMPLEKQIEADAFSLSLESVLARSKEMVKFRKELKKVNSNIKAVELKIEQAKLDITRWIITTSIAVTAVVVTALGVAVSIILKFIK